MFEFITQANTNDNVLGRSAYEKEYEKKVRRKFMRKDATNLHLQYNASKTDDNVADMKDKVATLEDNIDQKQKKIETTQQNIENLLVIYRHEKNRLYLFIFICFLLLLFTIGILFR